MCRLAEFHRRPVHPPIQFRFTALAFLYQLKDLKQEFFKLKPSSAGVLVSLD
jgi:hypothetical protein